MTQTPTLTPPTTLDPQHTDPRSLYGYVHAHCVVWNVADRTVDAYDSTGTGRRFTLPTVAFVRALVVSDLAHAQRTVVEHPAKSVRLTIDESGKVLAADPVEHRYPVEVVPS